MNITFYLFLTLILLGAELLYLRLARHFSIIDVPNERSSHTSLTTIRGGGILFWVAALGVFIYTDYGYSSFFLGLTLAAAISFLDDLHSVPNRYRIGIQFIAVSLLLRETGVFPNENWMLLVALVVGVGILNAYNFMDGINGITAFYSLVTVGTIWYWQSQTAVEPDDSLFAFMTIALLIFTYFNARRQAVCFAGDVGSVSIAFVILYALLQLINQQQTYLPVLLLAVYGVDSVLTIGHRLCLGENIFRAHRLHLFQLLVHRLQWPHLWVSALYAGVQLGINGLVLLLVDSPLTTQLVAAVLVLSALVITYVLAKRQIMSRC
ncbi:hypothetical protein ACFSUS_22705 [Spirosoma soli]|uniref:UDP-GlcNAc--UDP-phosphate GlcNAc-1-phosphate transferase n=1 Tax=Spirosoma soli TaxID=1770529 RepID=A0ABW5M8X0_9BACT